MSENRNSYFTIDLRIEKEDTFNDTYNEKLKDKIDLIFSSLGTSYNQTYVFEKKNGKRLFYFFKTEKRKRRGQVVKYCEIHLPENLLYKAEAVTKHYFDSNLLKLEKSKEYKKILEPTRFNEYTGNDLQLFEDKNNWHPWQREVYEMLFTTDDEIKQPHQRHIFSIVDTAGNSGKSSFFKYLFFKNPLTIGRLTYASASQLRSSSVNAGPKELYIIDLARSKSKEDRQEDLLSVVEDIKAGLVIQSMFGSSKQLLMEPPAILISSNYSLNYSLLSKDRWRVFKINSKKQLGKLNKDITEYERSKLAKK
jgi:hypothetical protein